MDNFVKLAIIGMVFSLILTLFSCVYVYQSKDQNGFLFMFIGIGNIFRILYKLTERTE